MTNTIFENIIAERKRLAEFGIPPIAERPRQKDLPKAAAAFALCGIHSFAAGQWPAVFWPWSQARFRLGSPRENLLRAAALLIAAIERLDRIAAQKRALQDKLNKTQG